MNLDAEIRNEYEISSEMKKVWSIQIRLLKRLLDVCEKYNLRIWADGGTLLGTIRHHGYIPWDDDIDMVMFRNDYDRLLSIAASEFHSPFFFQTAYSENHYYPRGHAQLRMDGTTAILKSDVFQGFHQGIFIDIFPYDAVPNDPNEMETQIKDRNKLMSELLVATYGHISIMSPGASFKVLQIKRTVRKQGFVHMFEQYENLFRRYSILENDLISCFSFIVDPDKFIRDKHWYDETIYLSFENEIMMPVPIGYHFILEKQYGKYMVPVKSPSFHGEFVVLDPNKSYLDYLPSIRKQVSKINNRLRKKRLIKRLQFWKSF